MKRSRGGRRVEEEPMLGGRRCVKGEVTAPSEASRGAYGSVASKCARRAGSVRQVVEGLPDENEDRGARRARGEIPNDWAQAIGAVGSPCESRGHRALFRIRHLPSKRAY
jgi:hypothetical protein